MKIDPLKILERAWRITWNYRALWVFGIILALVAGGGARGTPGSPEVQFGGDSGQPGAEFRWPEFRDFEGPDFLPPDLLPHITNIAIGIAVALACLIIVLVVLGLIARYVAETALIRMVDDHEETGEKRTVKQGFRLGWSRAAFRMFLIDLLIFLVVGVPLLLLFLLAFAPLLLWITKSVVAGVIGTVTTVGLFFLLVFVAIVIAVVLALLKHFFRRTCALESLGVSDSLREAYGVVRRNLKEVVVVWLIMVGLRIGLTILAIPLLIIIIPVMLLLILVAGVLGGLPALVVGLLASLILEGAVPWILGALVGIPIFILVIAVPWVFLGGLVETFKSSVWTITYRELRAAERMHAVPAPPLEPVVEAAE